MAYAATMTWRGRHPAVARVTADYPRGVTLAAAAMAAVEAHLARLPLLEMWLVALVPQTTSTRES